MLQSKRQLLINLFSRLILLGVIISLYVPFLPKMPAPGLDSSWALGLNQAIAQGLSFGKHIIFTLGPYSSIYTKAYHPATDQMMIWGSFYLAFFYWLALLFLFQKTRWYWILFLGVALFGMIYARDSLMFSYPLLVGLISYKIAHQRLKKWLYGLIIAPLGLLFLIKGSMLILSVLIIGLCFVYFMVNKHYALAIVSISAPLASLIFFWLIAGQSITYLLDYLWYSFFIASEFTEAMALNGNNNEIIFYLTGSLFIFGVILSQKQMRHLEKLFLLSLFVTFLFVSFKTGFTRHFGHAFIPGTSILLAGIVVLFMFQSKLSYLLLCFSLTCWHYINGNHTKISLYDNFLSTYSSTWYGLKKRMSQPSWLKENFALTMIFLRDQIDFPILPGTTDIYSYDQSFLISSQNTWSPRPIFQSYSVFSPRLAAENKQHLQGKHSPDNIIFKIEPIDERLSALEDGASWPLLLAHYQPTRWHKSFLVLQKKNKNKPTKPHLVQRERHQFKEVVLVPEHKQPLFVMIDIKPTLWGKLVMILFKPTQIQIICTLKNGTKKQYRFIASMGKSEFLLSPMIENTAEFATLFNKKSTLEDKKVISFTLSTDNKYIAQWNNSYTLRYTHYPKFGS